MDIGALPILDVSDLAKRFGARGAVAGVSFVVRAGEIYGLLGPNGAGKTTTIGMIAAIIPPCDGSVRILGRSVSSKTGLAGHEVGLVPQSLGLYPPLTAEENLRFFGQMYGVEGKELSDRVENLLELTGLTAATG